MAFSYQTSGVTVKLISQFSSVLTKTAVSTQFISVGNCSGFLFFTCPSWFILTMYNK